MQARRALRPPPRPTISRAEFLSGMSGLLGAGQRILYVPNGTDTTTSVESSTVGRTFTWDATIAARVKPLGNIFAQSFNGTNQWGDTPDAADLSFGNGTVDSAFSILALVKTVNVAQVRNLFAKSQASNREYRLGLAADNSLLFSMWDESVAVVITRTSTSAVTTGSWSLFGVTCDGRGGATAMDGVAQYAGGKALASVAANSGSYVAMENLTGVGEIGARVLHTQDWFSGDVAMIALTQRALTGTDIARIAQLCRQVTGLAL